MESLLAVIDHLVFAAPDLRQAIEGVEALTGVRAAIGGHHPGWRTRNALLALGPRAYLEVVGPDETPADPARPRPFGIDGLATPRLVTWAVRSESLDKVIAAANKAGLDLGDVLQGSRATPGGAMLRWRMTDLFAIREGGVVPFFIDWGETPHPAAAAPPGCSLRELRISHLDPLRVARILHALGLEVEAARGPTALEAVIDTPRGRLTLR